MKPVAILVEQSYQVLEVWYPFLRLKEEGIEAVFVGPEKKEYPSKEGYPVKADHAIKDVSSKDFSAIVVPGGWAPDYLRRHPEINGLVKKMFEEKKAVAAICHAGWVLASAGILRGKKATCFSAIKDDVINAGAEFVDKEVVVDGNLITSRTPYDLAPFCRELIRFLKKK